MLGRLEEHEQDLICLEKHENNIKKEKNKDEEVENNSITLMAYNSKSSTKEHGERGTSDNEKSDDEEIRFFVRRYYKYIKKNGIKHSNKNLTNYGRHSNTSMEDENKKEKSKGLCYNYGRVGHYKPDCPSLEKHKGNGQQKKSSKSRKA